MAASPPDDAERLERDVRSIKDPRQRAIRAVDAHREARQRAVRMTSVRRDALIDLHGTGMTWQEVADTVGMSLKAVTKATGHAGASGSWWKRIPDSEAERHKRGPGGIPIGQVIKKEELVRVAMEVMTDRHGPPRDGSGGDDSVTPAKLRQLVSERLGRPVAMPSLRAALSTLTLDGSVVRVGLGRYVAVGGRPGPAR